MRELRHLRALVGFGLVVAVCATAPAPAVAGKADVVGATAARASDGRWNFDVTVRHDDTGWDHYADKWDVLAPDGSVLATRILLHPHEDEQPFTRSISGVVIAPGTPYVSIRAHDKQHGYGGAEFKLQLTQ